MPKFNKLYKYSIIIEITNMIKTQEILANFFDDYSMKQQLGYWNKETELSYVIYRLEKNGNFDEKYEKLSRILKDVNNQESIILTKQKILVKNIT